MICLLGIIIGVYRLYVYFVTIDKRLLLSQSKHTILGSAGSLLAPSSSMQRASRLAGTV
jgi:hypothetical protein